MVRLNKFLSVLEASKVASLISSQPTLSSFGRPQYDPCNLLAAVLLGFTISNGSLRDIEQLCKTDLRLIYVSRGVSPSHMTFSNFIREVITPNIQEIFTCVCQELFKRCQVNLNTLYLDGTKMEANANKYRFVWKPTTHHIKLCHKVKSLLEVLKLADGLEDEEIFPSSFIIGKLGDASRVNPQRIVGGEKALNRMIRVLAQYAEKAGEYELKEETCGSNRNSYYKTDHDATAMCLKQDYYSGLGSSMHAAYSTQILVANGFIAAYLVSQNRADMRTLIPTIERFKKCYGFYPNEVVADAGYGSLDNYRFLEEKQIAAFVKYPSWSGESTGRRPSLCEYLSDGRILCLGGKIGYEVKLNRHAKQAGMVFFKVEGCTQCPFKPYCHSKLKQPGGNERIFALVPEYMRLKQAARDRLLTPLGIEHRVNRSCQVEGAYGCIKQDMGYTRFRRRNLENVETEFALTCLGLNLRKYFKFILRGELPKYWIAPPGLEKGTFKRPSAKRLANRVAKQKVLQPNEVARKSWKKKKN